MTNRPIRVAELSMEDNVEINALVAKLGQHWRRNRLRTAYYEQKHRVRQVGSVIPLEYMRLAMVLGWAGKAVDGLARRCHLDDMVWTDGDLDSLGLPELVDANFLYSEIEQGVTDSLIHGTAFLVSSQGNAGEPRALVYARDALNATGEWNWRRRHLDNLLSVTARDGNDITEFILYQDGITTSVGRVDGVWKVLERTEHPWHVPADPLPYVPRSGQRMGKSRVSRAVMSHQDAAARALIRMEAHMDIYAIPKLMMLGADSSIFKNADGSYKSEWQIVMGRVFGIPDDEDAATPRAAIEQVSAESPEPHLTQLNALAKLVARETDLPDSDFALTDMANPTSADAYTASRENLISTAEQATGEWSVPIRRTVTRALAMQNGETRIPAAWSSIDTKWRDPRYLSRSAAADAGMKQITAIPWLADTEVGLELLGLDRQQRERAMSEKRRAQSQQLASSIAAAAGGAVADPAMRSQNAAG